MYSLINQYAGAIVSSIPSAHVTDYEWLRQNIGQVNSDEYRRRYKAFWAMNAAQLGQDFYTVHFTALAGATVQAPPLEAVTMTLHGASATRKGRRSLQFSFATKLLHMVDPRRPIYDSKVAGFYFFEAPSRDLELEERITRLLAFHKFLVQEYARVLNCGLLAMAIQTFRQQRNATEFTDEKCIDSLLWAFVTLLEKGALPSHQIVYR